MQALIIRRLLAAAMVLNLGHPTLAAQTNEPTLHLPRDDSNMNSKVEKTSGQGIVGFVTAIATAIVIFAVQFIIFVLIRNKIARIL